MEGTVSEETVMRCNVGEEAKQKSWMIFATGFVSCEKITLVLAL